MTRNLFLTALICVCLLTACGGGGGGGNPTGDPPPTATVSATVTFNGAPLAGATVYAFLTNTNVVYQMATTDGNRQRCLHRFARFRQRAEEYQFWAIKAGYDFYPSLGSSRGNEGRLQRFVSRQRRYRHLDLFYRYRLSRLFHPAPDQCRFRRLQRKQPPGQHRQNGANNGLCGSR